MYVLMIAVMCLALLLTSCKRFRGGEPTARPTLTPTPRSTPLPPLPTPLPLGSADNPLRMEIVAPEGSQRLIDSAIEDLQAALLEDTQLVVSIDLVDSDAEALAALCASPLDTVTTAWLSGLAYAAAYAQNCGTAVLQVQRGERSSASTGDEARIIVRSSLDAASVGDLAERTFCRLGYSNFYSWLIPSLMLRSGGITSTTDLESVSDYEDAETMIADVLSGDCDAAGIAATQFDELASATARARIRTLQESVTIPYLVLVVPQKLPLAQRQQLNDALIAIGNGTRAEMLAPLLEQDQLVAVTDDELSNVRNFINRAGIDLAQAGT